MPNTTGKLIHIAKVFQKDGWHYLMLRKAEDQRYVWYHEKLDGQEEGTDIAADSAEDAIRLAWRTWNLDDFDTVRCGFRFTLPERDEIGVNALFHQMVASYSSSNGVYVDEELGHQCIVHDASTEARDLWQRLKDKL